jgi:hypothetical protein
MAEDQDFIDQYKELLIIQYSDRPNAVAEVELLMGTWSKVYDFFNNFMNEFDIDQAYGDRLDIIGKIVGVSRIVPEGVVKKYFSFSGNPNGLTFGEGAFFDIFTDSIYSSTQLNDAQYRFFIRSKIAKNITSAYISNDERVSLQETIQFLFNNAAFVVDNFDMSLTIYVDELYSADDLVLIEALDLIPKPQGVRYKFIVSYSVEGTFGFANNPNAKGFGAGKFASIIV